MAFFNKNNMTNRPSLANFLSVASQREAGALKKRHGLAQRGSASLWEAGPLTEKPGLSKRGQISHKEAEPQRKAEPLTEWGAPQR